MSFRRTTEEGEIGEEEGEIIASPPAAGDRGNAQPDNAQPGSAQPGNAPPPDHGGPPLHPAPYHHSSPPFRRFPPRGRGGGRGGRGPPPRQSSWTAGESRWGGKVQQGANEQQPTHRDFNPSFVGSSNEPIRNPIFARGESTGSVGSRNFPPTLGFGRNGNFGGRPHEPPRDAFGRLERTRSEGGVDRDAFGRQPPQQADTNAYNAPRPLERQRSEQADTGYGPRPLEHRLSTTAPPPPHRLEQVDTAYGPRTLEHRSSTTAPPPPHRSEQADTAYGPRPLEHRTSTTAPLPPHLLEQADTAFGPRPLEHRTFMTAPPPPHGSEQVNAAYGPRTLEHRSSTTAPPPPHRSEQADTAYGPRPQEHRTSMTAQSPPHRSEQADTAYHGHKPLEHRTSMTAPQPPHGSEQVDTAYHGHRPLEHQSSTTAQSPPHRSQQADTAFGPRPLEHRCSTTAPPPPHRSEQVDTAYGPRHLEHRTSTTAPPPLHRSEQPDTAYGPRPPEHRTSTAPPPLPFSAPPPPPNLPPPPPPPQRRALSYSTLTFDRPEAPHRASTISGDYRPDRRKSFEPSSPRFGPSPPQMQRKFSEGSSTRIPFESSPQMARKSFDLSSPRKGFESSPQHSRQTSAPSRFSEDSFRSLPPPPVTSSELLARAPRQDSWKASAPPKKEEPEPALKPLAEAPLTCSALGDPRIVARAEKVIQQLHELVTFPAQEESVLPTKQLILKAVAGVDLQIKMVQTNTTRVEAELQLAIQAEQDEAKRLEKEHLKETQRKIKLEQKVKEEKRRKEHRKELQMQVHERQRVFEQEKQEAQEALEEYVQQCINEERIRFTQEIKGQIEVASKSFNKDITKAQKALKKVTRATTKAESRMASAVAEYKQSKETEAALPELANEREKSSSLETTDMISSILAENKRRAEQAHLESVALIPYTSDVGGDSNVKTNEEWANEARLVTGLADALYTEPSESPYYERNNQIHALIEPLMTEHIRKNQRRLHDRWEELAEEYLIRKALYDKTHTHLHKEKHSKGTNVSCILGANPSSISGGRSDIGGGRATSNPYRRARRGNPSTSGDVVRSEYEQEQIIAELTAKEAMEKRIKHGGSKLLRQVCQLEKDLTATYIRTFESHRVEDMLAEAEEQRTTNVWSDMEKCIFLDRFMQHPKDFRKIASFLRNKSTKDCIAFYYNSKQSVPYKTALREHIMRRKRRGEYHTWDATIQAAISVGAVVTAGSSEAKPLNFSLPESDKTFFTHNFHPLNHEILAQANIDASEVDVQFTSPHRGGKSRKRSSAPLFTLDAEQRKLLRTSTQEDMTSAKLKTASDLQQEGDDLEEDVQRTGEGKKTPVRKAPQKWTAQEKKVFLDTLEKHGKNWSMLASAVGSKSISQIKNYYYDHKKQFSKHRGTVEKADESEDGKSRRASAVDSTDGDSDFAEHVEERHVSGGEGASPQEQGRGNILMESDSIFDQQGVNSQSLSSAADLWAHAQILKQQQQLSSQEARRLLHSHTHQQVMSKLSTMFPWVTAAHVAQAQFQAQAQAAALQQQQHQQQQDGISLGATHAAVRDWVDPATQMHNLLALTQAGHHGFSMDPSSHLRSMALAGIAAMNHQSLASDMMQMDTASAAPSSYHSSELDRAIHGFGGTSAITEGGFSMGHGGGAASAPSSSSSAALALGMLAHSMNLGDMNNGNGHSMDETKGNEMSDVSDQYQSG